MKNRNTKIYSLLLAVAVLSMLSSCRAYVWKPKGPVGRSGPVKQIIVDKKNSKKLYAATENGGVWVISDYTDETSLWRPLTDDLENLQTRGFDVSKRDPDVMVMGNGLGNLHLSRNGGESWSKINTQNFGYIRKIAIDDVLGTILTFHVASEKGLFTIEVRGNGQNPIIHDDRTIDKEILDFVIDRNSERQNVRYYAARNDSVFKSIDYGRTWEHKLIRTSSSAMIKIALPAKNGETVVKDGNQHFLLNDSPRGFVPLAAPDSVGFGSDVGYRNRFGGRNGDWHNAVAVDPDNTNRILVGLTHLESSDDYGRTFERFPYSHEDFHHIVYNGNHIFVANDGGVFQLNRNEDGSFNKKNGKLEGLINLNRGLNTYEFYRVAVSGKTAVGNADHNGIKYTQNLNSDEPIWEDVYGSGYGNNGLENDFVYKDLKSPDRFFVQFEGTHLLRLQIPYRAADNDLFFLSHPDTLPNPYIRIQSDALNQKYNNLNYPLGTIAQDPRDSIQTMLIASHDSDNRTVDYDTNFSIKIARNSDVNPSGIAVQKISRTNPSEFSYDRAEIENQTFPTWRISHNNGKIPIVSIAYSPIINKNEVYAYALDESGKVLSKENPNTTEVWSTQGKIKIQKDETMRQLLVDYTNAKRLIAISHERIFVSNDAGSTWVNLDFDLTNENKINTIAQHPINPNTLFIGTDRGVYYNKRNNWIKFGKNLPNAPVMQISIEGGALYATTFGRGLWRCSLNNKRRFLWASGS